MTAPACTCGGFPQRGRPGAPVLHSITCMAEAWTQPHAMVTDDGDVFYPDNEEDARHFTEGFDARPLRPDVFPFDCGGAP